MEAFAGVGSQISLAGLLVVPGLIGRTGLHHREDVDQAGMVTARFQDLGDSGLLADTGFGDELDLNAVFIGELLGVGTQLFT